MNNQTQLNQSKFFLMTLVSNECFPRILDIMRVFSHRMTADHSGARLHLSVIVSSGVLRTLCFHFINAKILT